MNLIKDGSGGPEPRASEAAEKRVYTSEELFGNGKEVIIVHSDARYQLKITKAGKLILNK